MNILNENGLIFLLAYFIGAFPTGYLILRYLKGVDIRDYGSGNVGATNILRILGWRWAWVTFTVDLTKGLLVVCLSTALLSADVFIWGRILAGIIALLGHIYPIYIGFRGGKGAAVATGVLFALRPWDMLIVIVVFVVVLIITRYVSLSTLIASLSFPCILLIRLIWQQDSQLYPYLFLSVVVSFFIVLVHRHNIQRLYYGREPVLKFRFNQ